MRAASGTVLVGIFDTASSFAHAISLADKPGFLNDMDRFAGIALRAPPSLAASVVFSDLPPGQYAVIVLHDENGNGRLDKNFWGVPTEPYGFSNDAQGILGPPGFEDTAVTIGAAGQEIVVHLVHHGSRSAPVASR